ncbi:AraC family transcriptional regulator [Shewanella fidelis]|uniref:AraC family transcriptional regulator n=1 Tax=Shewanella fidelis TaxID=173509 RepID=A0AAW8NL86_9GAMM|nr:AraC family transcriptional regulator [Shewanella fidelis]MDR8523441.1 AraC family transcriptional regulator [Shewanella fidelis]MDW4813325.1 AraC family transcriptional regulator [Shewanella fidelis]MDW4817303.1 AraC family transcriptional regulator [Shewanella fidelis]MDW4821340.1 AraC family transcriptional regulator [Shewanella fidelis]MDW4824582.1 AraC family transcriptional regulator [Shewanella fidelis]
MKPMCEKVIPSANSSWRFVKYELPNIDFNWHYHPEYEICLTLNSSGLRYVGDNIEEYAGADLVLVGPNMPHTWHTEPNDDGSIQTVYVAQLPKLWLEGLIDEHKEFVELKSMLALSCRGLLFGPECTKKAQELFVNMQKADPFNRFVQLVSLLNMMKSDPQVKILSSSFFTFGHRTDVGIDKLDRVIEYIYNNFERAIYTEELAEIAHMSTNHFHRFFKKRTERTLTTFINQLRIGKACKLLINSNHPIAVISDQCGFNNTSNFNRQFLSIKGSTPSAFRNSIKIKHVLS